jgi:hypothetical protein
VLDSYRRDQRRASRKANTIFLTPEEAEFHLQTILTEVNAATTLEEHQFLRLLATFFSRAIRVGWA